VRPVLFDFETDAPLLGSLNLPSYVTFLALSFAVGMWMTWRAAPAAGMDRERVLDLDLAMVVWGIVGARILHVVAEGHFMEYVNLCVDPARIAATQAKVASCAASSECGFDYLCDAATGRCHPPRDCLAVLKIWQGGLAFYGGFIVASVFGLRYARKHGLGMGRMADLAAPWIAFGLAVTRMGCFLNGCCYGKVAGHAFCVRFPFASAPRRAQLASQIISGNQPALPIHPTQLYLAALNLAMFFALYYLARPRKRFHGEVFLWLLLMKGVARSFVEIWRDDERGVLWGWLSTSQILSIPLVAAAALLLVISSSRARGRGPRSPRRPP